MFFIHIDSLLNRPFRPVLIQEPVSGWTPSCLGLGCPGCLKKEMPTVALGSDSNLLRARDRRTDQGTTEDSGSVEQRER